MNKALVDLKLEEFKEMMNKEDQVFESILNDNKAKYKLMKD